VTVSAQGRPRFAEIFARRCGFYAGGSFVGQGY
jgi:hypothetical protein